MSNATCLETLAATVPRGLGSACASSASSAVSSSSSSAEINAYRTCVIQYALLLIKPKKFDCQVQYIEKGIKLTTDALTPDVHSNGANCWSTAVVEVVKPPE